MSLGDNTLTHPLQIEDAREAQHTASETQREHGKKLLAAHFALADANYTYNTAKVARIKQLKEEGWAATVCAEIAKGEESIAHLRRERDKREGELEKLRDHAFTLGADRRALDALVDWSMKRELRTDVPPPDFDRETGEIREQQPSLRRVQ
jgi:hypothetical protein